VGAYRDAAGGWVSTKYREGCPVPEGAETVVWERRVFFCVPVPGEAPWAQPQAVQAGPAGPAGGAGGEGKRRLGEAAEAMEAEVEAEAAGGTAGDAAASAADPKRHRHTSISLPSSPPNTLPPCFPPPPSRGYLLKARRAGPAAATGAASDRP